MAEQRLDLELKCLFDTELNPVAPKAQRKVPEPEGLDLDEWINEPPSDLEDNDTTNSYNDSQMFVKTDSSKAQKIEHFTSLSSSNQGKNYSGGLNNNNGISSTISVGAKTIQPELSQEEISKMKEIRKMQNDSNPFYIKPKVKIFVYLVFFFYVKKH